MHPEPAEGALLSEWLDKRLQQYERRQQPQPLRPGRPGVLLTEPTPTPTPTPVPGDELTTLVELVAQDTQGARLASTGSFYVLLLMLSILIALVLFVVVRRDR